MSVSSVSVSSVSVSKKYRSYLYAGVAAAALLGASSGVWAQTVVNQSSTNHSPVTNGTKSAPDTIDLGGGNLDSGASASVSASGAVSATQVSGTGVGFVLPTGGFGKVTQAATNSSAAVIRDVGAITNGGNLGDGASASVSATGAAASLSLTGIDLPPATQTSTTVGKVSQVVVNRGNVTNVATSFSVGKLSGIGASASISATGAVASVGVSFINSDWQGSSFSPVTQTARNNATVDNTGNTMYVGTLSGDAASARISASGAITAVSVLTADADGAIGNSFGTINQTASNGRTTNSKITNNGSIIQNGNTSGLTGIGSSAVINATGAGASFTVASINDTAYPSTMTVGNITQTATNGTLGPVVNTGNITLGSGGLGIGASAAISAVGASSVVSFVSIK